MNFLNPEFVDKSFPICSFLDDNFYSFIPLIFYYTFKFPGFITPEYIIFKKEFLANLSVFDTSNYNNFAEIRNSDLYEYIFYFVVNSKDIIETCNFCNIKHRSEIINFVEFILDTNKTHCLDINVLKNYNISYEALKEFSDIIA